MIVAIREKGNTRLVMHDTGLVEIFRRPAVQRTMDGLHRDGFLWRASLTADDLSMIDEMKSVHEQLFPSNPGLAQGI